MHPRYELKTRQECFIGKDAERTLTIRTAEQKDLEAVLELQSEVHDAMPDRSMLEETPMHQISESIALDFCICVLDGDRLAAFSLMVVNRETERNLAGKLHLPPEMCVTFDTSFVHPEYRGLGLQRLFIRERERAARMLGAQYALCTVAPDNKHSLNNILSGGFEIAKRCTCYGNKDRYILKKELEK